MSASPRRVRKSFWFAQFYVGLSLSFLLLNGCGDVAAQQNHLISITPILASGATSFAVTSDNAEDGAEAIVDTCYWYWANIPGIQTKLVKCQTSVIPIFAGTLSLTDSVPVSLVEIQSVRVRIVKVTSEERFPYKEAQP